MDIKMWTLTVLVIVWWAPTLLTGQEAVSVRLVGGLNGREGRVEVYYNQTWGTICDDDWDVSDAAVVCRMLGIPGLARAYSKPTPFGSGTGPVWMDSVTCSGNEASIAECRQQGWGQTDCDHDEDAGVTCLGDPILLPTTTTTTRRTTTTTLPPRICSNPSQAIRLDGGSSEAEGRVMVFRAGQWGGVCDDHWGLEDAKVICRMLCYNPDNARAHLGGRYGNATESYQLDDVRCSGSEDTIDECPKGPWGDSNCDVTEAAGASCIQDDPGLPLLPSPEIRCENSEITAIFDRLLEPRLRPEYLSVVGADDRTCNPAKTLDVNYVTMKIPFIGCGTLRTENLTHIMYENAVRHAVPAPSDVFTRTAVYHIPVTCLLPREGDPENNLEPGARTAPPATGKGAFDVRMSIYLNNRFRDPVERFPARVVLGEVVYVAMSLFSTDKDLKLIVPTCWATPERDPESEPKVFLVRNKCSDEDSVTFYPINETMFAFRFQSFKFLGNFPYLYVHCEGYVCAQDEKTPQCDRSCSTAKGRRRRRDATYRGSVSKEMFKLEEGPLVMVDTMEDMKLENQLRRHDVLPVATAISVSSAVTSKAPTIIVGVLLVGILMTSHRTML